MISTILNLIDNDEKQNALDFINYLKLNKLSLQWGSANSWRINYKSKCVCYFK